MPAALAGESTKDLARHRAIYRSVAGHRNARRAWRGGGANRWTEHVTKRAGDALGSLSTVHRWSQDSEGESEYLGLDLTAFSANWGPVVVACEFENRHPKVWPQYALWKLLSVKAEYRLLFAYFNSRARIHPSSPGELVERIVKPIRKAFTGPDATAYLMVADSTADAWAPSHYRYANGLSKPFEI